MTSVRRRAVSPVSVSSAILAVIAGVGLAVLEWWFPVVGRSLSTFGRAAYWTVAAGACVWGSLHLSANLLPHHRVAWIIGDAQRALRRFPVSGRALVLMLVGIELLTAPAWLERLGVPQMAVAVAGMALLGWGLLEGVSRALPRSEERGPRNQVHMPRPGIGYIIIMTVLFVGSLLGRSNMLLLMFALMAGPFVFNGWLTFSQLRRIRLERRAPSRVMAGDTLSVEMIVKNRKRWLSGWLMMARDPVEGGSERLAGEVLFARIPPRDQRSAVYQLKLARRGPYRIGPATVTTRFPLGLVERGIVFDDMHEILVYPRIGRLTPAWKRQFGMADELVNRAETRRGVFDDEFHGIREFRWGDNPRAIHWRTTARLNQTMVREFHQSRDRNLLILLDLQSVRHPDAAERTRLELAISFAATVCVEQMRRSRDARLSLAVAGNGFVEWDGVASLASIEPVLEMLALVEEGATPDRRKLLDYAAARRTGNTSLLLVTTRSGLGGRIDAWMEQSGDNIAGALGGNAMMVEADPVELSRYFQLDWDQPGDRLGATTGGTTPQRNPVMA